MKANDFNIGDKVVTIKDGELRKGVIKKGYPVNPPVFLIEYEDGNLDKIPYGIIAPEPKTETPEDKNEPIEKTEITITPGEFKKISYNVSADIAKETNDYDLVLTATSLWAKLYRALFIEPCEND